MLPFESLDDVWVAALPGLLAPSRTQTWAPIPVALMHTVAE